MSTPDTGNEQSHDAGTQLRRPPRIFLIMLALIILGAGALLAVLLTLGDDTDMEEQPVQNSSQVGRR